MIPTREILACISAKVNKPFAWCIFTWLTLIPFISFSQTENKAIYQSDKKQIVLLRDQDSIVTIKLDKSFFAQLSHEKKRKKKTVYYRLARYENPVDIKEVPVVIANNNIQLHLQGTLQGDTSAKFSLIIYSVENGWNVEIKVPDISVNQFSFSMRESIPLYISCWEAETKMVLKKKKKNIHISFHGPKYRVAINYPSKKAS